MKPPDRAEIYQAFEATWPAARLTTIGPFKYRDGAGGGSRVSSATLDGELAQDALESIEARFVQDDRPALFQVRSGEESFDALLATKGYRRFDPVACLCAPADVFATSNREDGYPSWPPLAIQKEIWAAGGVGDERLAVMDRVSVPKTTLLGRLHEAPAGTAFLAQHGEIAALHALEIAEPFRRAGLARAMMAMAADWARAHGAKYLALQVTRSNSPALSLYSALGMNEVAQYHYRTKALSEIA
ncbi:GNAT family N-acetyltransferase [Celeribacter litoreus]|uniref:GNAT family N-acetyltransferase n=1 Tax=Celeribacter litoreus TaxID=2876714 RepID=UPI001CCF43E3|nr:GNAT family N-acetyltransferase [Celeribacter litoreus]MCA0042287.1 GNAT family N-acetyltransferase [Celeribacter litoreus]